MIVVTGDGVGSSLLRLPYSGSAHAFAGEFDAMGIMDETVHDGVRVGRIADDLVPSVDWKLRGDDRRSAAVALFEDFEQIMARGSVERFEAPIVEDEQIATAEGAQQAPVAAVAARQGEILEQPRDALVENRVVVAASLVAERTSEPAFSGSGWTNERQIIVGLDPLALSKLLEQGAVETARIAVIDVFDAGLLAQSGDPQAGREALVLSPGDFAIEQQSQPFTMAEAVSFATGGDFDEGLGHAMQAEGGELVEGRMIEQDGFS
jgi:hypothetical protein